MASVQPDQVPTFNKFVKKIMEVAREERDMLETLAKRDYPDLNEHERDTVRGSLLAISALARLNMVSYLPPDGKPIEDSSLRERKRVIEWTRRNLPMIEQIILDLENREIQPLNLQDRDYKVIIGVMTLLVLLIKRGGIVE